MKTTDITKSVTVDGHQTPVTLGDTVWWFAEAQTQSRPSAALVIELSDDNQVTLAYIPVKGSRLTQMTGVCLMGDKRLSNANFRKQGCWCPRALWDSLKLK